MKTLLKNQSKKNHENQSEVFENQKKVKIWNQNQKQFLKINY